ncbi:MAG: dihydrolipoyl dehydrogenase [Candidatus Omnitrophica bacterium]|nr:dihydrolipoyl dehydrogenase [Candidatus Omnitrophota bacterium]
MERGQSTFDYDLAVIGAGSAGYAAARTAAEAGLRVAVLEGGKEIGGLCILRGCMPTKALLYAADVLHMARRAGTWGIQTQGIHFDFSQVMARKAALIAEFARFRQQQLNKGRFKFLQASGRFVDEHTLALSTTGTITAKNFVISTGSNVSPPALPRLKEIGYLTSDTALSLAKPPRSLVVLGGGPVAVELAQFFNRFNVKVTLVQRSEHVLHSFDASAACVLESVFRREGMTVFTGTKLIDAWQEGGLKGVSFHHQGQVVRVAAEEILLALGRTANIASLGLENAGVFTEGGRILTNTEMQTTAHHIYAAGDCTDPHQIVHLAVQQGEIAAHNIAHPHKKRSMDYRLLCQVIFTDPQLAQVGLTEKEAQVHGRACVTASYPFNDHGKSIIMDALDGYVKLLADPASGEILGGSVVGPMGGELIHEIIAAIYQRMTVHALAAMPHYHPTLAEIWTYPAEELARKITPAH